MNELSERMNRMLEEHARCNEAVRVPRSRLEARQRQGERPRLGLGCVRRRRFGGRSFCKA